MKQKDAKLQAWLLEHINGVCEAFPTIPKEELIEGISKEDQSQVLLFIFGMVCITKDPNSRHLEAFRQIKDWGFTVSDLMGAMMTIQSGKLVTVVPVGEG